MDPAGTLMGDVIVWDAKIYEQVFSHKEDNETVTGVDFDTTTHQNNINGSSTRLLVGLYNRTATVWDVATRKRVLGPLHHEDHDGLIAVKYSPQGDRIATATVDYVRVYDSNDGRLLVDVNVTVTAWSNRGLLWSNNQLFIVSNKLKHPPGQRSQSGRFAIPRRDPALPCRNMQNFLHTLQTIL